MTASIRNMVQMLPYFLILFSCYYAIVTYWISRKLLTGMGEQLPRLAPMKSWMLPRSLVWYYFIALLLDLVVTKSPDSAIATVLANLIPILMIAFSIQAIGFLFFMIEHRRWSKGWPIAGMVLMVIFPPIQYILSFLGVFDVAFQLRKRISDKNS
jgi:uncharacterized protein YybS (DUF2232 family)